MNRLISFILTCFILSIPFHKVESKDIFKPQFEDLNAIKQIDLPINKQVILPITSQNRIGETLLRWPKREENKVVFNERQSEQKNTIDPLKKNDEISKIEPFKENKESRNFEQLKDHKWYDIEFYSIWLNKKFSVYICLNYDDRTFHIKSFAGIDLCNFIDVLLIVPYNVEISEFGSGWFPWERSYALFTCDYNCDEVIKAMSSDTEHMLNIKLM